MAFPKKQELSSKDMKRPQILRIDRNVSGPSLQYSV